MKISFNTSYTNPESRNDPWKEAMNCYHYFSDEVIVTGENWPEEFKFSLIGEIFQEGFEKSEGDWVIHMDIDNFIHEEDRDKLFRDLKKFNDFPAISFQKFQFFNPNKFSLKSRMLIALNKSKFPNLKLNGGGDLCQPTLNGKSLEIEKLPKSYIPIWNYDSIFKTKNIISQDRARFARAWYREFGNYGDRGGPTETEAFNAWSKMISNRLSFHVHNMNINQHPKFIKESLKEINDSYFGFNNFEINYKKLDLKNLSKEKINYLMFLILKTINS